MINWGAAKSQKSPLPETKVHNKDECSVLKDNTGSIQIGENLVLLVKSCKDKNIIIMIAIKVLREI